jgi:HlyD family secretion protein
VALLALGIVGLIAWNVVQAQRKKVPRVNVERVERRDLERLVTATGKIEAQKKVELSAPVMGQIVNLAVREGDRVRKGDFLLQIDQTQRKATALSAEASLKALFFDRDAARAQAEDAKRALERAERSFAAQLISQAELDRARSNAEAAQAQVAAIERRIDQARASLAGARDELAKTKMTSPIDGIVTSLTVEEGEIAVIGTMNNPGTKLMTISDMSVVQAVLEVDETDIPYVRVGQSATVRIDAYPERSFSGVVTEVGSSPKTTLGAAGADTAVNFEVKIELKDPPEGVRPGFSCAADILTGSASGVLTVPIQALVVREREEKDTEKSSSSSRPRRQTRNEEEGVYLFEESKGQGTVRFQPIETGLVGEMEVEVVRGLEEGQLIVTGPFKVLRELKNGDRVRREGEQERKGNRKGS